MTTRADCRFDATAILMAPPDITNGRLRTAKLLSPAYVLTVEQANRGLQRAIDELRLNYESQTSDGPTETFRSLASCHIGHIGYEVSVDITSPSAADSGGAELEGLLSLAYDFAIELDDDSSTQQRQEVIKLISQRQIDLPDGAEFYTYEEIMTLSLVELKRHLNQLCPPIMV